MHDGDKEEWKEINGQECRRKRRQKENSSQRFNCHEIYSKRRRQILEECQKIIEQFQEIIREKVQPRSR